MFTLNFAGRELGTLSALQVTQEASAEKETVRWQATLEICAATPELVQQAVLTLESRLSGTGSLELRHGQNILRSLQASACSQGPKLSRRSSSDGDDSEAHPMRIVSLEFDATLHTEMQADPGQVARSSESLSSCIRRRIVDLPLLAPGAPPWRQEIGAPVFEITQEGEAAGSNQHPPAARPLVPADVIERRVSYLSSAAAHGFVTRWRYVISPLTFMNVKPPSLP